MKEIIVAAATKFAEDSTSFAWTVIAVTFFTCATVISCTYFGACCLDRYLRPDAVKAEAKAPAKPIKPPRDDCEARGEKAMKKMQEAIQNDSTCEDDVMVLACQGRTDAEIVEILTLCMNERNDSVPRSLQIMTLAKQGRSIEDIRRVLEIRKEFQTKGMMP